MNVFLPNYALQINPLGISFYLFAGSSDSLLIFHRSAQDFVQGLSILSRGSPTEKLEWVFNLYDLNRDGCITAEEMLEIVNSVYSLLGHCAQPCVDEVSG